MHRRLELQALLEQVLGSEEVYFQPPPSIRMSYPAIRYSLNDVALRHANNGVYQEERSYSLTLISFDPDDPVIDALIRLPKCRYERQYVMDNLYHNIFTIYF